MRYLLLTLVVLLTPALASGDTDRELVEKIDKAIARGVRNLYREQNDRGTWEVVPARQTTIRGDSVSSGQWGGLTALSTYTLLACGENPRDERVEKAIDFLMDAEIVGNYALGCRAQVWPYLPTTKENDDPVRQAALRDAKLLFAAVQKQGKAKGLYDYLGAQRDRIDLSVSQYGVLGMWACSEFVEVQPGYWREVEQAWLRWQQPDGGWAYNGQPKVGGKTPKPVTASMTAAGIATLYLTQDFLVAGQPAQTRGNLKNPAIDKAMGLMIAGYPELIGQAEQTPFTRYGGGLYTLYGVERIGVASGLKYFGDVNWYEAGARHVLKQQKADGSWGRVSDTCFALLFLSRGREPVMMNKASYAVEPKPGRTVEGHWNQRPRDVANVARWVGKTGERTLNWQIIDLAAGDVRDLHDAPILFLAGNQPLRLTEDARAKVKRYLLEGGMLVLNPDGNSSRFEKEAVDLGTQMFEAEGFTWRTLPDDHPIFTNQQYKTANWRRQPQVRALSNGVRELIVMLPGDMAASWQTYDTRKEEDFQLASNLYLYAIDKDQTYFKGDTHLEVPDEDAEVKKTLKVARVRYDGNWNPEPAAFEQLATYALNEYGLKLEVEAVDLAELDMETRPVAHLTGAGEVTDESLAPVLKAFVEQGGALVIDAAGGDPAFTTSIERILAEAFGPERLAELTDDTLPGDHPLYAEGGELGDVGFRLFAEDKVIGALDRPRLRGFEVDGELRVIYSPEDLTNGVLGAPVDGIYGYRPSSAKKLMTKALLHVAP